MGNRRHTRSCWKSRVENAVREVLGVQGTGRLIPAGELGTPSWMHLPLGTSIISCRSSSLKSLLFPPAPLCPWDCKSKSPLPRNPGSSRRGRRSWFKLPASLQNGKAVFESHRRPPRPPCFIRSLGNILTSSPGSRRGGGRRFSVNTGLNLLPGALRPRCWVFFPTNYHQFLVPAHPPETASCPRGPRQKAQKLRQGPHLIITVPPAFPSFKTPDQFLPWALGCGLKG